MDPISADSQLASQLAEYHQTLLEGEPPVAPAANEAFAGGDEAAIASARRCLASLEALRRALFVDVQDPKIPARDPGDGHMCSPDCQCPPRQFGRFAIIKVLGCGSQGIVFHARDPVLNRDVALKIPRPETLASPELRARFVRESEVMARLSHPHIVTVLEVGQTGPAVYIASQFCPGPTLGEWTRSLGGPLDYSLAAELVAVLAETVDYIHAQGILHRDIKPGNVLLEPLPTGQRPVPDRSKLPFVPKLTDFGLARLAEGSGDSTRTGMTAGTPAYMSPEQAAGRSDEVDERADIYALGAVLYELLSGQLPFAGRSPLEVLQRMTQTTLTSPRRLRRDLPRDLAAICLKCLEPDKRQRYATAAALAADLRRFQFGQTVQARPVGIVGTTWKRCRRQPVLAALSLALIVSLFGGLGAVTWQWRQAVESRELAEANYQQARRAVAGFFEKLNHDPVFNDPAAQAARLEMLSVAQQYYEEFVRVHGSDRELELNLAEATYRMAFIINTIGSRVEALQLYEKSLPMWERLVARYPELSAPRYFLVKTHTYIGQLHEFFGKHDDAMASHRRALRLGEELVLRHPNQIMFQNDVAMCCRMIGLLHCRKREFDQAHDMLDRARAIVTMLVEKIPTQWELQRSLGSLHYNIGSTLRFQGSFEPALAHLRRSQQILESLVDQERDVPWSTSDLTTTYQGLGELHVRTQRLAEAQTFFDKACQMREAMAVAFPQVTSKQRDLADSYMNLAKIPLAQRRWEKAIEAYERALPIRRQLADDQPGPSLYHRTLAETLSKLAYAQLHTGELENARRAFLDSQKIYQWLEESDYRLPSRAGLEFIDRGLRHVQSAQTRRDRLAGGSSLQ